MSLDFYLYESEDREHRVLQYNITHNLVEMAKKAGIYEALWHPYRLLDNYNLIKENTNDFYNKDSEFEKNNIVKASLIIPFLEEGLKKLQDKPEYFQKFNPTNGWGSYDGLLKATAYILAGCKEFPESIIQCST